ncbi:hypothetical protein [Burkholderia gladioli]|uniref:hypothetical protein n=1 Tax=Burkholderia gladioli TaxID=28095 RepID=UPI00164022EC|nr:hypothetical protein [Burkholderia gladioli]
MSKYETLDALILAEIGSVPKPFGLLYRAGIVHECDRLAMNEPAKRGRDIEPFRILDRRLQALRKGGKIRSSTKGWTLAARDGEKS